MDQINARIVNCVNAYTANALRQTSHMGKRVESEPSAFWVRLTEAWGRQGLPISQNGIASKLDMSQGSTRRWYTGDGYPEIDVLRKIATLGHVTVDWLLMDTLPRSPIGKQTPLGRLLQVWEQLDEVGRDHVYMAACGALALMNPNNGAKPKKTGTMA